MSFKNMSLRGKLIGGFTTVLLLLIVVSAIGFLALSNASKGFAQYREMARDANLSGRLQANMLMVRMNVKDFIITGSKKDEQQYQDYYSKMTTFLETAKKEIQNPERAKKIKIVSERVKEYKKAFATVLEIKKQRNHLVYDVLGKDGKLMEQKLTQIMTSAKRDQDIEAAFRAGLSLRSMLLARVYVIKFMESNSQKDIDRVNIEMDELAKYLEELKSHIENPERKKLLQEVMTGEDKYHESFKALVQLIFKRNEIITGTLDKIGPEIAGLVEEVKLDIKAVQDEIGPRLQAANQNAEINILIASLIALVAGIGLVFFTTRSVLNQLGEDPSEIAEIAKQIADGNLVIDFKTDTKQNTTSVYYNMKIMSDKLRQMFTEVASGIKDLTASSTGLSGISEQMTTNSEQAAERSTNVSAAAEEMSTNMNSVAAATEQTSSNIQMIVAATEEMSVTINEIAGNTAKGSETTSQAVLSAKEVSVKVTELGKASTDISKVTETIADISEQTNLLALNATIEAARAGEAGKGFAVVAGEIKELAKQTAEATSEINEKISSVQNTTAETVTAIDSIVTVITDINEIVISVASAIEEQSATTQEISNNVSQAAAGVQEVNENVNQTSSVTEEVTQDITMVSQAATEINTGSKQVNKSAQELAELAETLSKMVQQYKI